MLINRIGRRTAFTIVVLFTFATNVLSETQRVLVANELETEFSDMFAYFEKKLRKKKLGLYDPHLPVKIKIKPDTIKLSKDHPFPEHFLYTGDGFMLQSLNPDRLSQLSRHDLRMVLAALSAVPLKMKIIDKRGHAQSGKHRAHRLILSRYDETNAAYALMLLMATYGEAELFADMIALAPDTVLAELYGHARGLFDSEVTARAIVTMMEEVDTVSSSKIALSATALLQSYIHYWARKSQRKMKYQIFCLLVSIEQLQQETRTLDDKKTGLLLGSMLAACLHHADKIKSTDEKRIWMVNTVSNLIWAATTFLSITPIGAEVSAAVAGTISIGTVLAGAFYTQYGQLREFAPTIIEVQGFLEMSMLDAIPKDDQEQKVSALSALQWMTSAIHINGFST